MGRDASATGADVYETFGEQHERTASPARAGTLRVLSIVTDSFGGRGGIAQYNRHFLRAVSDHPHVGEVVVVPRSIRYEPESLPPTVRFVAGAARGGSAFVGRLLGLAAGPRFDLIVCAHLHLLPFARALQARSRCPLVTLTFGLESWKPTSHLFANRLARSLENVASIRDLTKQRLQEWSGAPIRSYFHLPNCVDTAIFRAAPRREDLVARWGLHGSRVVMIAGRMDAVPFELKKGFEELIAAFPRLQRQLGDVKLMIVGDGADRPRLAALARERGVGEATIFTGYVTESEKADYYRLADVFAMPGSNPAFDRYPYRFVFLEAAACGVPIVGARADGPGESDDPLTQALLYEVEPSDPDETAGAIARALTEDEAAKGRRRDAIGQLSYDAFDRRVHAMINALCGREDSPRTRS